jgi:hypothetical protein
MEQMTTNSRRGSTFLARYRKDGFYFPFDAFSRQEADAFRRRLDLLEPQARAGGAGNKGQLNHAHVLFRFCDEIVRNPKILDAVEDILGSDLMVWGSTFFIKEAQSPSHVSWHQDLRYWGLDDAEAQVSVWVALSPVTRAHGCMRFVPGSHKGPLLSHKDSYAPENFLTRGQVADIEVDEDTVVHVELAPGQASFHHGKLLHASGPNRTDERRIGLTINYIAPHVRQTVAKEDFAMLVRGEDCHGNFRQVPPPDDDLSSAARDWHARILAAQNVALYQGANKEAV